MDGRKASLYKLPKYSAVYCEGDYVNARKYEFTKDIDSVMRSLKKVVENEQ